ncbi:cytochrome c3 family protein [Motiliproteus sediminis]|uniref:cytochrome c3 family protein n=1 Tax=Motiliproteus sediminis TaxID=1468178 RepID=UPI001AEF8D3B|nr:cytochrome c3 family protein [Motiliproteus sediminis]
MRIVIGAGCALAVIWALSVRADPLPGSPLEAVPCATCHLETNASGIVPKGRARLMMEAQEMLCLECHRQAIETGHPSGFIPARPLSADYPLDFAGFLTCSSCHWIHEPAHGAMRAGGTVSESCLGCHDY